MAFLQRLDRQPRWLNTGGGKRCPVPTTGEARSTVLDDLTVRVFGTVSVGLRRDVYPGLMELIEEIAAREGGWFMGAVAAAINDGGGGPVRWSPRGCARFSPSCAR